MVTDYNKVAGESIRFYRESKGLSLRDLSGLLKIPYTSIAKMENGDQRVDSDVLVKMADIFDVSLDRMLNRQQNKTRLTSSKVNPANVQDNFKHVLDGYLNAKNETFKGHSMGKAVRETLKDSIIDVASLNDDMYLVTGSVGQGQWAEIPWVAIFLRNLTTTATKGYDIVYLFTENMDGFYISLNQGYTYYKEKYGTKVGKEKIKAVSSILRNKLHTVPDRLKGDQINLKGNGNLSQGYEGGHIFGRYYSKNSLPSSEELIQDLLDLIIVYRELEGIIGNRSIEQFNDYLLLEDNGQFLEIEEKEEQYQDSVFAVQLEENNLFENEEEEDEDYPEERPDPIVDKGGKKRWPRDAKVAAKALKLSNYLCACEEKHETFISKATGNQFMEAHHLVPMKLQIQFDFHLDKVSNILSLCPVCHRLLHHGPDEVKKTILEKLFYERMDKLKKIGILINFNDLKKAYGIDE
ncbi:MrcB family domain-containing protein [Bacillus sp. ISL-7]|uniref:MrcB family domain-containing protein n=1 Tax=Bacillus sp. ISL-7 TaxID=2819136 RepID=UPI001BEBC9D1|nr:DUF3578 domain-containing protein [Bacillus sp. ISL-7]MBT2734120.1 DUF3578 domain-containing protein [Bacillus sp. ISL-7]